LESMTPGLSKTPEGNRLIIKTAKTLLQRQQQVARMAREYRKKHGTFNEGFFDEMQDFADANPLFEGQTVPQAGELTTEEQTELNRLRKKYGR